MMANELTNSAESNETGRPGIVSNVWRCARRGFAGCIFSLIAVPLFLSLFLAGIVVMDYLLNSSPVVASVDVLLYVPGFVTIFLVLALSFFLPFLCKYSVKQVVLVFSVCCLGPFPFSAFVFCSHFLNNISRSLVSLDMIDIYPIEF